MNLFLWQDSYPIKWCFWKDWLVLASVAQDYLFFPHHGTMSPQELTELSRLARKEGKGGNVFFVNQTYVEEHRAELEGYFSCTYRQDYSDYIYKTETLAHLGGTKLAKRRNQINQFYRQVRHPRCMPLRPERYEEYASLLERWNRGKDPNHARRIAEERKALSRAFEFYDALGLQGRVLFGDHHVLGLSLFSVLNDDCGIVHFEKADVRYKGAYQVINKEVARVFETQHIPFVNREQDLGIPGLRHTKESYMPEHFLGTYFLYPR